MDRKAFTIIAILRNIVAVYFSTFFAIYFFKLVNYELLPMAIYYLLFHLFITISFWLLRRTIRHGYKVAYYRIGISLMALYLALIMLLKEDIVKYIYVVAIIKGLSEGFYYYPRNILNTEKIKSNERRKYDGLISAINELVSIVMPFILGILLTLYDYITIGKYVFIIMIVIFFLSFFVKEEENDRGNVKMLSFFRRTWANKKIRHNYIIQFLKGFTISSGVLIVVMTIYKILFFQSNFKIGSLNSILGIITFLASILYASKKKKNWYKPLMIGTLVIISIMLTILSIKPTDYAFIIYLVVYAFGITIISLITDTINANRSNDLVLKFYREEYQLALETFLGISRFLGYALLLVIGLFNNIDFLKYILFFSIIPLTLLVIYLMKDIDDIV